MGVVHHGVEHHHDEAEGDEHHEPQVEQLHVRGADDAGVGRGVERGEHQQARQGHHDPLVEVAQRDEQRHVGDEQDQEGGEEVVGEVVGELARQVEGKHHLVLAHVGRDVSELVVGELGTSFSG